MNANPKFLAATAHVDEAAVQPLPASRKVYVPASARTARADARDHAIGHGGSFGEEKNPPLFV
jgi:phosphomethylpyrimidine synthase